MNTPEASGEITTEWLEVAISHTVTGCRLSYCSVDNGFGAKSVLGDVARVNLVHSASGCHPESLIVKFPTAQPEIAKRAAELGLYAAETKVYSLLSEHSELPVPTLIGSFEGKSPGSMIIVLEDMSPGEARSQASGCSPFEIRQLLDSLADIHALFWGDARVPALNPVNLASGTKRRFEENLPVFVDAFDARLGAAKASFEAFIPNVQRMAEHRSSEPTTLIHSDIHAENILFYRDSQLPIIIDWQLAGRGVCAFDISQLLVGSMSPVDRREQQGDLLRRYFGRLMQSMDVDYSYEDFFLDYRAAAVSLIAKPVSQFGGFGGRLNRDDRSEVADALFERVVAAIEDLDPIDALHEAMSNRKSG